MQTKNVFRPITTNLCNDPNLMPPRCQSSPRARPSGTASTALFRAATSESLSAGTAMSSPGARGAIGSTCMPARQSRSRLESTAKTTLSPRRSSVEPHWLKRQRVPIRCPLT